MTEIQADPRRCTHCQKFAYVIEKTKGGAFLVYKCYGCGRETVVDRFNLEVK